RACSVRAINLNPTSPRARAVRGYLYRKKGDLDRAIVDYGEIIRIDPKSDEAYMRRSEAWLPKGARFAALSDADEAVKLDPNAAVNYGARAAVMSALSRKDDAIA